MPGAYRRVSSSRVASGTEVVGVMSGVVVSPPDSTGRRGQQREGLGTAAKGQTQWAVGLQGGTQLLELLSRDGQWNGLPVWTSEGWPEGQTAQHSDSSNSNATSGASSRGGREMRDGDGRPLELGRRGTY